MNDAFETALMREIIRIAEWHKHLAIELPHAVNNVANAIAAVGGKPQAPVAPPAEPEPKNLVTLLQEAATTDPLGPIEDILGEIDLAAIDWANKLDAIEERANDFVSGLPEGWRDAGADKMNEVELAATAARKAIESEESIADIKSALNDVAVALNDLYAVHGGDDRDPEDKAA